MSVHDATQTAPQAAASPAAGRKLGLALLVLATAQLMLVLDDTIVNVALPSMQRSLHIATPHLNWVASFYALAFGGLLLAGGRAGDLLGRLRMFRIGIIVFALASMARCLRRDAVWLGAVWSSFGLESHGGIGDRHRAIPYPARPLVGRPRS